MTSTSAKSLATQWRRPTIISSLWALLGVGAHVLGPVVPPQLGALLMGCGLVGASFLLAWAADAGDAVFSGGLVLTAVALVTVLPEFIIEIHFAFVQATDLVTANLTGATRLLLTGASTLPIVIGYLSRRTGKRRVPLRLAPSRRLELGILLITSLFGIQIIIRGSLTVLDGLVLITLYVLYTRRVQGTPEEDAALVGVSASLLTLPTRYIRPIVIAMILGAGAVVLLIANPFADDLLVTGASVGIDPYLLVQSVVPVTTEAPEILVVAILVKNQRPAQGLALFLAASVSQSTLGIGALPFAYLAGGGGVSMAVAPREQVELALTNALTLFVVAALCTRRPERVDALFVAGLFALQILYPSPLVRLAATFVLLVFAISLLASRRRFIPAILRAAWGSRRTR